jgi:Amidase
MSGMSRRGFIQTSATGVGAMRVPHSLSEGVPTQGASDMAGQDLCFMSATALAADIRAKRVSPVEVVNAIYTRIHEINPRINAFCTLTEEQAHRMAKQAEAAVMRGDRLGPLHGVPVSIKGVFLTRGVRTMFGSRIRENYVPEEDAKDGKTIMSVASFSAAC